MSPALASQISTKVVVNPQTRSLAEALVYTLYNLLFLCTFLHVYCCVCTCTLSVYLYIPNSWVIINPRCACAARVTVVGSVCPSVKSHLTSGASVRLENAATYSAGNEGQKIVGFSLKLLRYRDPALPAMYGYVHSTIFTPQKTHMRFLACTYRLLLV